MVHFVNLHCLMTCALDKLCEIVENLTRRQYLERGPIVCKFGYDNSQD